MALKMTDTEIRLLDGLGVRRNGEPVPLPASRKTRALLAWLALEPGEHRRSALCDLLWAGTADPRGALRWSLTKLRSVLGADALVTTASTVGLDPQRVRIDAADLAALLQEPAAAETARLERFVEHFDIAPLAELDVDAGAEFELWLESQAERLRRLHQKLLAEVVGRLPPDAALPLARRRVALDPLNQAANEGLLRLLYAWSGRQEAQAALERMRGRLREAGLSDGPLLGTWRRLSAGGSRAAPVPPVTTEGPSTLSLPERPSVAVLGFEQAGAGDPILAEGLAVDLTFKLARLKGLFVTARASALRFDLSESEPSVIGQRLGVRYLLHGTVQQFDQRVRVTVDLIERERGEVVWAERFDRSLDDLFAVQDAMADAIVAALQPQIERAEQERARFLPTEHLGAWGCYHRAMWHSFRFTRSDNAQAVELLQRALALDPQFARAHAGLSFSLFSRAFLDSSRDRSADLSRALDSARESVGLEPRDALGHWSLGRALFLHGEHDQALAALDRALVNNPNYAQGLYARGFVEAHAGMSDQAVADLEMAQRLSPFDPLLFAIESSRAVGLAVEGRYAEAADWAVRATCEPNAHFHIFAIAGACLELAGRHEEAARQVARAKASHAGYSVAVFERSFPQKSSEHRRVLAAALRAAGLKSA